MSNNLANYLVAGWLGFSVAITGNGIINAPLQFFMVLVPVIIINGVRKDN